MPDGLLFLHDGTIRVSQSSDRGREIVLYRVEAGESCVLTTACMLAEEAYNAEPDRWKNLPSILDCEPWAPPAEPEEGKAE